MIRLPPVIVAVLAIPWGVTAQAQTWAEYRSENFVVYTEERERVATELIEELEVFRGVAHAFLDLEAAENSVPVKAYLLPSDRLFEQLDAPDDAVGLYRTTAHGGVLLYRPRLRYSDVSPGIVGRARSSPALAFRHQYTHHLLRSSYGFPLPYWYEIGVTRLLTVSEIGDERIELGTAPIELRVDFMERPIALVEDVLDVPSLHYLEFDAEIGYRTTAWLMVHYLQLRSMADPDVDYRVEMDRYLRDWVPELSQGEYFRQVFDRTPDRFDRELDRYRNRQGVPVVRFSRPGVDVQVQRKPFTMSQAAAELSHLAYALGIREAARNLLPQQAAGVRAILLSELLRDDNPLAIEQFDAIASDARSTSYSTLAAELAWTRYLSSDDYDDPADEWLARTQALARHSISANQNDPAAHRLLGLALAKSGESVDALRSLMAAYEVNRAYPRLNLEIAELLIDMNRPDLALPFVQRATAWSTLAVDTAAAERLSARVDNLE